LTVRPVRPDDAAGLADLVALTDAEDVQLRFHGGVRLLPDALAARLSQIDYDREMALAATDPAGAIVAVARLVGDPEGETAEFALLVRSDHQSKGLGRALMERLITYARGRGLRELWGSIEARNDRMLTLAADLGFRRSAGPDATLVRASLVLA